MVRAMGAKGLSGLIVLCALLVPSVGLGGQQAGDPPSLPWIGCDRDIKPCGDPLVIEAGRLDEGRYETVGMDSRLGLCLGITIINRGSGGSLASCGGAGVPEDGKAVAASAYGWESGRSGSITQAVVRTRADVSGLRIRYRSGGRAHVASAPVAPVNGELLAGLGQPDPFGVATAILRGCTQSRLLITAYGKGGSLGHLRLPSLGRPCRKHNGSGFAIFVKRLPERLAASKLQLRRTYRR